MTDGKVNILVVDDRPDKLLALEAVLSELGENLVMASSGREALRHLLTQNFGVILLDVNMPGMDGLETAELIRQRPSSRDTPIIFVTAYADEMHIARGYSLGAVDYILAPVVPEVLRTKVRVFVDLYRQQRLVEYQAEAEKRRAGQLQKLAAASVAINAARSLPALFQIVADSARDIVQSHQAITVFLPAHGASPDASKAEVTGSFSDKFADWRGRRLRAGDCMRTELAQARRTICLTNQELRGHADWQALCALEVPPLRGILLAPLAAGKGRSLGLVYLSDKIDGEFTEDDAAILTQLAQMASVAIENALFSEDREANRLKEEFLATLSHELRTPLNAILGWTQLLRSSDPGESDLRHALEVIERNVKAQTRLIEDLLDISRITTGKLRLNVRPMCLHQVVDGAIESARPGAASKGIRLESHCAARLPQTNGDPDRIQQVVWNLLSNAIKFTPAGGSVRVEVDRNGASLLVRVKDTGKGINPAFLPYVFDRFRQADSSTTRSVGGLGIGLAIVRHLVELHGGAVHAHSLGEGQGSTFTVELPLAAAAPHMSLAPRIESEELAPPPPIDRTHDVEGLQVLAVDDEPDALELIRQILQRAKVNVATATSVAEAMQLLDQFNPDVLISDIGMPVADGYTFIRQVRQRSPESGGNVPAIALTAYVRDEDRARMIAAGFTSHVPKPVEPGELVRVIAHISGRTLQRRPEPQLKLA